MEEEEKHTTTLTLSQNRHRRSQTSELLLDGAPSVGSGLGGVEVGRDSELLDVDLWRRLEAVPGGFEDFFLLLGEEGLLSRGGGLLLLLLRRRCGFDGGGRHGLVSGSAGLGLVSRGRDDVEPGTGWIYLLGSYGWERERWCWIWVEGGSVGVGERGRGRGQRGKGGKVMCLRLLSHATGSFTGRVGRREGAVTWHVKSQTLCFGM